KPEQDQQCIPVFSRQWNRRLHRPPGSRLGFVSLSLSNDNKRATPPQSGLNRCRIPAVMSSALNTAARRIPVQKGLVLMDSPGPDRAGSSRDGSAEAPAPPPQSFHKRSTP